MNPVLKQDAMRSRPPLLWTKTTQKARELKQRIGIYVWWESGLDITSSSSPQIPSAEGHVSTILAVTHLSVDHREFQISLEEA